MGLLAAALLLIAVTDDVRVVPIAEGWAKNSVNTVIFRRNSLVSDESHQYAAFYNSDARVVVCKRDLDGTEWETRVTRFSGNAKDAHNTISLMIDGDGFLHMAWDHHVHPLRYSRSVAPGALEFSDKIPMTGKKEERVTYPEFYALNGGDLLFLYRDGESGRGDLMINHYDAESKAWTQRKDAVLGGEGERNAYWQLCTDEAGTVHLSWVWRETGDVASNHDIGYARSEDAGVTWLRSDGEAYGLPITQATAEYAARVPVNSELMNTQSMCADEKGRPYIANYWRPEGEDVPQYHVVFHDGSRWQTQQVSDRKTAFRLGGSGTRRSPMSRCLIFTDTREGRAKAYMLFRDEERGSRVSLASCDDLAKGAWRTEDLTETSVGMWEPSYDTERWRRTHELDVFVQFVGQGDGERIEDVAPQMVSVLEWRPASDSAK